MKGVFQILIKESQYLQQWVAFRGKVSQVYYHLCGYMNGGIGTCDGGRM